MGLIKGIIKVGASGSKVKFNNIKMVRVLTNEELEQAVKGNDASFIVLEQLGSSDKEFTTSLCSSINIPVYFYNCSDEYDGVYRDLKSLQRDISFKLNHNVRTYRKGVAQEEKEHAEEQASTSDESTENDAEIFGDLFDDSDAEETTSVEESSSSTNNEENSSSEEENTSSEEENTSSTGNEESAETSDGYVDADKTSEETDKTSEETDNTSEETDTEPETPVEDDDDNSDLDTASELSKALEGSLSSVNDSYEDEHEPEAESANIFGADDNIEEFVWGQDSTEDTQSTENESEEIQRLKNDIELKERRIAVTEERLNTIIEIKESLQDKVDFYEGLIKSLESNDNIIDIQTKDSDATLTKLKEYKLTIKDLENKVVSLQTQLAQIDSLQLQLQEKDKDIKKLKSDLVEARTDDKYKEILARLENEIDIRLHILTTLKSVGLGLYEANKKLDAANNKIKTLTSENETLNNQIKSIREKSEQSEEEFKSKSRVYSEKIRALNLKLDDFNKKLVQSSNDLRLAEKEKQDALNAKTKAEVETNSIRDSVKDLQIRLKTAQNELDVQTGLNDQLKKDLQKFEALDIAKLQEDVKVGEVSSSQLMQELGRTKQELQSVTFQLGKRDEIIKRLEEDKTKLEITNKGLARGASTFEKMTIDINYIGKAPIIAVFGRGGCGTTTTVMSIADRLPGNILVLDFDTNRPGIDGWVGMNPMIKALPDLSPMHQSGFGALMKQGATYVIEHRDLIVRKYKERKGQALYYFSGYYGTVDMSEIASIDFNQFLNFFGNEFNYIVVDLGTLGGGESTNTLIRSFNKISWRNVMLCLHDKYDIRLQRVRSNEQKIMYTKTIWLLNYAKSTKIDASMEKSLNGMNYTIFNREMDYYGDKKTFFEFGNPNRDRIKELAEKLEC